MEVANIYTRNSCSTCSSSGTCGSNCLKENFCNFLQCVLIFIKRGGTEDMLVVELPPLCSTVATRKKICIIWCFGFSRSPGNYFPRNIERKYDE